MKMPMRCPVCDGWGTREPRYPQDISDAAMLVTCAACSGSGIVILEMSPDEIADMNQRFRPSDTQEDGP